MGGASRLSGAFANIIKKHRIRQGLSQEALAESAGIHHTYVSLLGRGRNRPTIEVAARIAEALGVKLSALIEEAERE
ncbi:MAG: helix-turn-helix domain-containing protein [Candidatus Binataceae bacterium]